MFFRKNKNRDAINDFNVPQHVAIIMDGNARWAKKKNLPLKVGHKIGAENLRKIAENCIEFGIKFLTVYAFSSENWDRPKEEVDCLMKLLEEYLEKEAKPLMEKNIKIVVSGNLEKVSKAMRKNVAASLVAENVVFASLNNASVPPCVS